MIGDTLAHYRILDKLGEGGMGEVYLAEDTKLKRKIALKVLPSEMASNPDRLRRFEREAEAVASLNHPNIVTIYSVEEVDGLTFLTMELAEGESLATRIPLRGFSIEEFFHIAVQLTDALSSAHERGVVHRDIKPDNIMVSDEGRVKILDFGLAKLRPRAETPELSELETEALTREGRVIGTVPYMSPEQACGKPVDHRSDIFSLGLVLHEMATGKRVFRGQTSSDILLAILKEEPPSVTDVREDLPFHLGRIIRHCLFKSPEHRYQSAQDLRNDIADLDQEVASGQLRPKSLPTDELPALRVGRRRFLKWGGLALLALAIPLAILLTLRLRQPTVSGYDALAVLPFDNLTGSPTQEYISEGIALSLINQLSELAGLRVIGRSEAWSYRGQGLGAAQLGKRLGVGLLLEGDVQQHGERLLASVRLTSAGEGAVLWADEFERPREDLLDLQQEISRSVTRVLRIPLSMKERRRLQKDPTISFRAYDSYLQGQQFLEALENPRHPELAADVFRRAIDLDAEFALAHVGLSEALLKTYIRDGDGEALEQAEHEAERAAEIDPNLPAARVALARIHRTTGRHGESVAELRQALMEHPKPDEALRELAFSYWQAGDLEAAEDCLRSATDLASEDWYNWNELGFFLLETGRYGDARPPLERAASLAPANITWPSENLALARYFEGDFTGAIAAFEEIEMPSEDPVIATNIGTAYFFAGRYDRAEELYLRAVRLNPSEAIYHRNLADVYARQGRSDDARERYAQALDLVEERVRENPKSDALRLRRAVYAAKASRCDTAVPVAGTLRAELPQTAQTAHALAQVFALCGEQDTALATLRIAIQQGFAVELIREEDEFRLLHGNKEFRTMVGLASADSLESRQ
jgi:serine/threonine protein kinase/Flp pilus assembly protein TadD